MKENNYNDELNLAKNIAKETWRIIAPIYDAGVKPDIKGDGSPVTIADKKANEYIVREISKKFPNDSIVSEELGKVIGGKRTWYIDPIDGTRGFVKRNGQFAIHIGFCEEEKPTLGVVYWPVADEMYSGIVGNGAWRENPRNKLELKVDNALSENLIAITNDKVIPSGFGYIFDEIGLKELHHSGSEGLRVMKIAENLAHLRITERDNMVATWDVCAPLAILEAAGGHARYIDGSEIKYTGQSKLGRRYIAANNIELIDRVIELNNGRKNAASN